MAECKHAVTKCKSDFSFALLLVTFEPLEVEQSYIPHLKALMCGINAAEAQGCDCMFTFCHAYPKMGVLLHKTAIVCNIKSITVKKLKPEIQKLEWMCADFDLRSY